ncbi:S8 family serine peptidase [Nonomuraea sp. NPDC002799]
MPRRLGLPSVYLAAAVATAATTAVPLAMTPASGLAARPAATEPVRPYIVIARGRAAARDLVGEVRWRVRRYYAAALPGFATFLTARELAELRDDPRVRAIEADRQIRPLASRPPARALPGAPGTGAGSTVYVLDSGVGTGRATNPTGDDLAAGDLAAENLAGEDRSEGEPSQEGRALDDRALDNRTLDDRAFDNRAFDDRAWRAFDATGGTGRDCLGHGTQTAGRVHAIAPKARIASVRVLGCGGSGSLADVLAGLDWIRRHARGPSVANLSIDGAGSLSLDRAVRNLVRSGVFVVQAADSGTCQVTPGGQAYSASAPYVAGAAARLLERHPAVHPAILGSWLKCTTARGVIRQNPSGASNLQMRDGGL